MKKPNISKKKLIISSGRPNIPNPGERRPDLASLEDPGDFNAPFDSSPEASRGLQKDVDEEVGAALQSILDERKQKRDKYRITNDQDYYFLVCFQTEQQKLDFLDKTGWKTHEDRLMDGLKLAQSLGVDIEPINLPMREFSKSMPVDLRAREVIK